MFVDMTGFTSLSENLGPERTLTLMDQVFEILINKVHDYDGAVNELRGDGVLALFGAPMALEDAPQRAVRSALAIHDEMIEFNERIKGTTEYRRYCWDRDKYRPSGRRSIEMICESNLPPWGYCQHGLRMESLAEPGNLRYGTNVQAHRGFFSV
jgi:hypothetical protein